MDFVDALALTLFIGPVSSLMFFVPLWGPHLVFAGLAPRRDKSAFTYSTADFAVLFVALSIADGVGSYGPDSPHEQTRGGLHVGAIPCDNGTERYAIPNAHLVPNTIGFQPCQLGNLCKIGN